MDWLSPKKFRRIEVECHDDVVRWARIIGDPEEINGADAFVEFDGVSFRGYILSTNPYDEDAPFMFVSEYHADLDAEREMAEDLKAQQEQDAKRSQNA